MRRDVAIGFSVLLLFSCWTPERAAPSPSVLAPDPSDQPGGVQARRRGDAAPRRSPGGAERQREGVHGRFGAKDTEALCDRICRENGIDHLLTAPRRPTTIGKIERLHDALGVPHRARPMGVAARWQRLLTEDRYTITEPK